MRPGNQARPVNPFTDRLGLAPVGGSFAMPDHIIWGGSVVAGDDGRFFMFASRWPKALGMKNWVVNSEIVLATSDRAEGPYHFEQVVLPARESTFWDGMVTHNPTVHRWGERYVLFYTGSTYDFLHPDGPVSRPQYEQAWNGKRIGVAVADSPYGPWARSAEPILQPRPGGWDGAISSNPAPVIHDDGSVLLVYKSAPAPYPERNQNTALHLGVATARSPLGPYRRLNGGQPIRLPGAEDEHLEDPYLWRANGHYHLVAKTFAPRLTGENGAGIYAWSEDGVHWRLPDQPQAYSRWVRFSDGHRQQQARLERPQVLVNDGQPTHIFFATMSPDREDIYNLVVPIIR